MTKKIINNITVPTPDRVLLVLLVLLFGLLAFIFGGHYSLAKLATGAQIEASRKTIIQQFLPANSISCSDSSDTTSPTDRVYVFFEYLRVNKYANRAVIRGCNNIDHMLMKTASGQWIQTNVNLNLDKRASPVWQKVCLVDDITIADTVSRPENKSIDDHNLSECRSMLQTGTDSSSDQVIKVNN